MVTELEMKTALKNGSKVVYLGQSAKGKMIVLRLNTGEKCRIKIGQAAELKRWVEQKYSEATIDFKLK